MNQGVTRIEAGSYSNRPTKGHTSSVAGAAWVATLLSALAFMGCTKGDVSSTAPAKSAEEAAGARATTPSPRRVEATWLRGAEMDPMELQRLADAEGADGLLEAMADPALASTALAALPYADDALAALGQLALRAAASGADRAATLEAIVAIAHRPRQQRELVDAEGIRAATELLFALSQREDVGEEGRATALSALRSLEGAGFGRGSDAAGASR